MNYKLFLVLTLLIASADHCLAKEIPIDSKHRLYLKLPKYFQQRISRHKSDQYKPAIQIINWNRKGIKTLSFKIFVHKDSGGNLRYPYQAIEYFKSRCQAFVKGSVEQKVNLQFHTGVATSKGKKVYYCKFTDRKLAGATRLEPKQFRFITVAYVQQGNWIFRSVAYSKTVNDRQYRRFLDTLSSLDMRKR